MWRKGTPALVPVQPEEYMRVHQGQGDPGPNLGSNIVYTIVGTFLNLSVPLSITFGITLLAR